MTEHLKKKGGEHMVKCIHKKKTRVHGETLDKQHNHEVLRQFNQKWMSFK